MGTAERSETDASVGVVWKAREDTRKAALARRPIVCVCFLGVLLLSHDGSDTGGAFAPRQTISTPARLSS
jgi:hypothetical protein